MKQSLLLMALLLMSSKVFSDSSNIQFQNIRVGGLGCPSDITQIATAPDLSAVSLIFQSFESHVPTAINSKGGGTNISLLNCNVFLDIKIPAGQKLDSIEISYDMRGHAFLEQGVMGSFKSYLISSSGLGTERTQGTQQIIQKNWINTSIEQDEDFTVSATKTLPILSQCGSGNSSDKISLHLQHQLGSQILMSNSSAQGTITMDSSDMTGGLHLQATTSACRPLPTPVPPGGGGGRNCRVVRINGRVQMICQ